MKDLELKVFLSGKEHDLDAELAISIPELSRELSEQPSRYAYWAAMETQASHAYDSLKTAHRALEAEVASELRSRSIVAGAKKSEKQIEQELAIDDRVKGSNARLQAAKRTADYLKVAVRAFEQRLQALISIGALERAMAQGVELSVRSGSGSALVMPKETMARHMMACQPTRDELLREVDEARVEQGKEPRPLFGKKRAS